MMPFLAMRFKADAERQASPAAHLTSKPSELTMKGALISLRLNELLDAVSYAKSA
jgi:hypothetical protein